MSSYDSLGLQQNEGTIKVPRSGVRLRYASNGTVRPRAQSSATRWDPQLFHKAISLDDWNALQQFAEDNRGLDITVTFSPTGESLTCVFAEKPFDMKVAPGPGAAPLFDVTVYLVQSN